MTLGTEAKTWELAEEPPSTEALFRQARRRRRRRRAVVAGTALAAAAAVTVGLSTTSGQKGGHRLPAAGHETPYVGPVVDAAAFHGHGDLAFVSLGGLYVLDGSDDKLTQVEPVASGASDPQFSPNGKWLTFSEPSCAACFYLAHADGSGAHAEPLSGGGSVTWLANGDLVAGSEVFSPRQSGQLALVGHLPPGLVAWSPGWDEFAFETSTVRTTEGGAFRGGWSLQVAPSLSAKRALWYEKSLAFSPVQGLPGEQFAGAEVLPDHGGVLFWVSPGGSAAAEQGALPLYWLPEQGATPVPLGSVGPSAVSLGPDGTFAVDSGAGDYAFTGGDIEICTPSRGRCSQVRSPAGEVYLDPTWSPGGRTLAFVGAAAAGAQALVGAAFGVAEQSAVVSWYSTHHLLLLRPGSNHPIEVAGTQGVATPAWSADGRNLLYVADNSLWLLPRIGSRPVNVASPLMVPGDWGAFFGEVNWELDFSWSVAHPTWQSPYYR
jgi:WD40-like Beta Propeller Repeat